MEAGLRPDVLAHEVEADKQDCSQDGPDSLKPDVAVAVLGCGFALVAIFPGKQPERDLRRDEHDAHGDVGNAELRINLRAVGGGHGRQPHPGWVKNEKVRTDEGDQPDNQQDRQAHASAPSYV